MTTKTVKGRKGQRKVHLHDVGWTSEKELFARMTWEEMQKAQEKGPGGFHARKANAGFDVFDYGLKSQVHGSGQMKPASSDIEHTGSVYCTDDDCSGACVIIGIPRVEMSVDDDCDDVDDVALARMEANLMEKREAFIELFGQERYTETVQLFVRARQGSIVAKAMIQAGGQVIPPHNAVDPEVDYQDVRHLLDTAKRVA